MSYVLTVPCMLQPACASGISCSEEAPGDRSVFAFREKVPYMNENGMVLSK